MGTFYRDNIHGEVIWIGDRDTDIGITSGAEAPVLSGANATGKDLLGKGSVYIAQDSGVWYNNIGTKASPVWKDMTGEPTLEANAVSTLEIDPPSPIESDDEPVQAVITAELDEEIAGIPVTFTTAFLEADFDDVLEGDVEDFAGAGLAVMTDEEGKAILTVVFTNGVDKETVDITAAIDDSDRFVGTTDTETIAVTVDTTPD